MGTNYQNTMNYRPDTNYTFKEKYGIGLFKIYPSSIVFGSYSLELLQQPRFIHPPLLDALQTSNLRNDGCACFG